MQGVWKNRTFWLISRFISEMIQDRAVWNANRNSYAIYQMVLFPMPFSKLILEWLSEIFNDLKHRAASLRQLRFLSSLEERTAIVSTRAAILQLLFTTSFSSQLPSVSRTELTRYNSSVYCYMCRCVSVKMVNFYWFVCSFVSWQTFTSEVSGKHIFYGIIHSKSLTSYVSNPSNRLIRFRQQDQQ